MQTILQSYNSDNPDEPLTADYVTRNLVDAGTRSLRDALPGVVARLAAQFLGAAVTGGVALLGRVYTTLQWAWMRREQLRALKDSGGEGLRGAARYAVALVKSSVLRGLKQITCLLLDFLVNQFGLDRVADGISRAFHTVVDWVRGKIERLVDWLLRRAGLRQGAAGTGAACALPRRGPVPTMQAPTMPAPPARVGTAPAQTLMMPRRPSRCRTGGGQCLRRGTLVEQGTAQAAIEALRLGDRVQGRQTGEPGDAPAAAPCAWEPASLREVRLVLVPAEGVRL